ASEWEDVTFKSVILAGVYDIKNVQKRPLNAERFFNCGRDLPPSSDEGAFPLKMRPDEEHQYNSPWNVTADFDVDMSFHADEIAVMLNVYRDDHGFIFDTEWFAGQIYDYTSGYPFLVSRICWLIDTKVARLPEFQSKQAAWTQTGFQCAIKLLQKEQDTLFDDLNKKLDENSKLKDLVYRIVVCRENVPFNLNDNLIKLGAMFGWFKDLKGMTAISNRIFETIICDKLLQERTTSRIYKVADLEKYQMKTATDLDMDEIIARFSRRYKSIYADRTSDFLENEARIIFLTFLKPIINGSGNYYMEPEAADKTRVETPPRSAWRQVAPSIGRNAAHLDGAADIIVDYQGHQYIIEAKVWHGESYEQTGREQLAGYLKRYDLPVGWLISFCFNKDKKKLIGTRTVEMDGKIIRETVL
ncbi:MAG: hypothetical protein LUF68_03670, partial [Clostridiales bacterium]|nr:hypothetical protein [Clostridiales bacterium]